MDPSPYSCSGAQQRQEFKELEDMIICNSALLTICMTTQDWFVGTKTCEHSHHCCLLNQEMQVSLSDPEGSQATHDATGEIEQGTSYSLTYAWTGKSSIVIVKMWS